MDWDLISAAKAVFEKMLDASAEERERLLEECGPPGSALRLEVEALFAEVRAEDSSLRKSLPELLAVLGAPMRKTLRDYEILRPLGQGGMGRVYLARKADRIQQRDVAIKVVHREFASLEIDARFRREVTALSKLSHPNIVQLLDGGVTEDGLLYMVMEFVAGVTLDEYCREHATSEKATLGIFLQLCEAVSYAHRNLIIHRDLKPSNVLVTEDGTVKLLDFGVAKLLDEDLPERFTTAGFNRVTLEYASPEQLRSGSPVSTTADVYSLGVILYQILTGRLPYNMRGGMAHEVVATVLEDEPVRPTLNGELTAILLCALRKEPERRYSSVDYLKDDIVRYLGGHPVTAFRDSAWYRVTKFIARRRKLVAAGSLAAASVLAATGIALYQAKLAVARSEDLRQIADSVLHETAARLWSVRGGQDATAFVFGKSVEFLERLVAADPGNAELKGRLVYSLLMFAGNSSGYEANNVGDTAGALRAVTRARDLVESEVQHNPRDTTSAENWSHVNYYLGKIALESGDVKLARASFDEAVRILRQAHGDSREYEKQETFAYALSLLGLQKARDGDREGSYACHRQALTIREANAKSPQEFWRLLKRRRDLSIAWYLLALSQESLGGYTEALATIDKAIGEERYFIGRDERDIVAEVLLAQRLVVRSRLTLRQGGLAQSRLAAEEAVRLLRKATIDERVSIGYQREFGRALGALATVLEAQGQRAAALANLREQLAITKAAAEKDSASAIAKQEWQACQDRLQALAK